MKSYHLGRISLVFLKMLGIFLIVVIPLFLSALYINFSGQSDLENETINSAIPKVDFYADRLENDFKVVSQSVMELYNNADVKNLSLTSNQMEGYDRMRAILDVGTRLVEIKRQGEFISQVCIYIPMIRMKIASDSVQEIPPGEFEMFRDMARTVKYPFLKVDSQTVKGIPYVTATQAGADYYMCLMPFNSDIMINGVKTPQYIVTLKVNQAAIRKMLKEFSDNVQGSGILLNNVNGLDFSEGTDPGLMEYFLGSFVTNEDVMDTRTDVTQIKSGGREYLVAYKRLPTLDSTLLTYISRESFFHSLVRYRAWLWIVSGLTLLLVLCFTLLVRRLFIKPLDTLVDGFSTVEGGTLDIELKYRNNDEFGYLYQRFNGMCRRLGALIEQVYEQRIRAQNAELKQLQYQINPHFLYNSLFILYRMAKMENIDGILKLTEHLGGYYQFVTKSASDEVTLAAEFKHAMDYVQIQSIRFANRIRFEFPDVPEDLQNMMVPRLILQPIIENAYNHGLAKKLSGGMLKVRIGRGEGALSIFVEDNGDGMNEETLARMRASLSSAEHISEDGGLVNIHRRLIIRYGAASGLFLSIGSMSGLCVEMRIITGEAVARVQVADRG